MALRYSCAFILVATLLAGCDVRVGEHGVSLDIVEGKATDEWTGEYTLDRGGQLEIVNTSGPIDVFPATGLAVEVRATREVKARTDEAANEALRQVAIREEVTSSRVKVETAEPGEGGFRGRVTVAYRVNIPPGLSVALRSQTGGVRLENVDGRFTVATTNGSINGRGVSGTVDASTVNGGINMELAAVTGDVRMVTVNGGIRLDVSPDVNATLEATAVNGGVVVREGFPLEATDRQRLRVAGRINKGGPRIVAQTTNGGVVIGGRGGRGRGRGGAPEVLEPELR